MQKNTKADVNIVSTEDLDYRHFDRVGEIDVDYEETDIILSKEGKAIYDKHHGLIEDYPYILTTPIIFDEDQLDSMTEIETTVIMATDGKKVAFTDEEAQVCEGFLQPNYFITMIYSQEVKSRKIGNPEPKSMTIALSPKLLTQLAGFPKK